MFDYNCVFSSAVCTNSKLAVDGDLQLLGESTKKNTDETEGILFDIKIKLFFSQNNMY